MCTISVPSVHVCMYEDLWAIFVSVLIGVLVEFQEFCWCMFDVLGCEFQCYLNLVQICLQQNRYVNRHSVNLKLTILFRFNLSNCPEKQECLNRDDIIIITEVCANSCKCIYVWKKNV